MNGRANKGGQHGINGEWYEGGQYLPNTHNPKGSYTTSRNATHKQEIAPFTYAYPPKEGLVSIYRNIAGTVATWTRHQELLTPTGNSQVYHYYGYTPEQVLRLTTAWNNGARWMDQDREPIDPKEVSNA